MNSQINLRPGYIITNQNDTLSGMIDFRTAERNARICSFRPDSSSQIKNYRPGEIYAYQFTDDGKFYITRQITIEQTSKKIFLEYLIKGTISLFYYKNINSEYYFFENEEGRMFTVSNEKKIVEINGRYKSMYNPRDIGIISWLFNKSDNIKKELKHLHIDRSNLSKITKQYHYETCQTGEDCIEFETRSDKHFFKMAYYIDAGFRFHKFYIQDADNLWKIDEMRSLAPSIAAGIDLSIPRLSHMMSLKAEAELSGLKGEKDNFTPKNVYNKFYIEAYSTDIRAGLAIRLSKISFAPCIEGGFCETFLWGMNAHYSRSYFSSADNIQLDKKYNNKAIYRNYTGYYVNIGCRIPLKKKGALSLKMLYEQRKHATDIITTWGANIGYIF